MKHSTGATLANVNDGILLTLRLPTCTVSGQVERVRLSTEAHRVRDNLGYRISLQIESFTEHRQALIAAAVTGGTDVAGQMVEEAS